MRGAVCLLSVLLCVVGCTRRTIPGIDGGVGEDADVEVDAGSFDAGPPPRDTGPPDAFVPDAQLNPDAACASATVEAEIVRQPVDIIWVVDNSASMELAIEEVQAGLNAFAQVIGASGIDYQVIMLSLRGRGQQGSLYRVCIPPPLSGDGSCGDGERFFQIDMDVKSTQPLEQLLGTLGQTTGYTEGTGEGGPPWHQLLRPEALKTLVFVTDDNARMMIRSGGGFARAPGGNPNNGDAEATVEWFETTAAGDNPYTTSRQLPEGLLHPRWDGLFEGYTAHALYNWGSDTDPEVECEFPGGGEPQGHAGETYTELVAHTGGVRARICDGPAAWTTFFDAVASTVEESSSIDCEIEIPAPPDGMTFRRDRINVFVDDGSGPERAGFVDDGTACGDDGGWYYNAEVAPTHVILCPATCDAVQPTGDGPTGVDLQFGCATIII